MNPLEKKYFIDQNKYNCPYCGTHAVQYRINFSSSFDWNKQKKATYFIVSCTHCYMQSFHLTYTKDFILSLGGLNYKFNTEQDIDGHIFFSVPRSPFEIDPRIPTKLRTLLHEAAGCLNSNFLTGASACIRKTIYELLVVEEVIEPTKNKKKYEEALKSLKDKHPLVDPSYFDVLGHIQGITSDQVHESAWEAIDSKNLLLFLETLKTTFFEIYIAPLEREERKNEIIALKTAAENKNNPPKL
jgi:hypothetical protein